MFLTVRNNPRDVEVFRKIIITRLGDVLFAFRAMHRAERRRRLYEIKHKFRRLNCLHHHRELPNFAFDNSAKWNSPCDPSDQLAAWARVACGGQDRAS
jgi:hypothetical protein